MTGERIMRQLHENESAFTRRPIWNARGRSRRPATD